MLGRTLVTGSSNPLNLTDFDTIITLVEGQVGAAFGEGGYAYPVSSVASVAYVYTQKIVKDGAIAQLLESIPGQAATAKEMRAAFDKAIAAISDGSVAALAVGGVKLNVRGGGVASPVVSASWFP